MTYGNRGNSWRFDWDKRPPEMLTENDFEEINNEHGRNYCLDYCVHIQRSQYTYLFNSS